LEIFGWDAGKLLTGQLANLLERQIPSIASCPSCDGVEIDPLDSCQYIQSRVSVC